MRIQTLNAALRQLLHLRADGFKKFKRLQRPRLLQRHKTARLEFERNQRLNVDKRKKGLFSEDKKIYLDVSHGFQRYWHDGDIPPETFSTIYIGGSSIMVWGAFSYRGTIELKVVQGRHNAAGHIGVLK